jgi:hypothetical protein
VLNIHMLPALEGDCLLVEYGEEQQTYRMLIDGGRAGTYDSLKVRLGDRKPVELLVVSHVDADHIEGVIRLLYVQARDNVHPIHQVWFNGHGQLKPDMLGPVQGEYLSALIEKCKITWNAAFSGQAVKIPDTGRLPVAEFPGGMRLTVLSPNQEKLDRLLPEWGKTIREAGLDVDNPEKVLDRLEEDRRLIPDRLGEKSVDMKRLLDKRFTSDHTLANGTSITFLAEHLDGAGVVRASSLLLADTHVDVLISSIKRLLKERANHSGKLSEKLSVGAVKVPHHGSKNNVSPELIELLDCDTYLISTNGNTFHHPDQEAVARIIEYNGKKPTKLYFNYHSEYNRVWGDDKLKNNTQYETYFPELDNVTGLTVRVGNGGG